MPWWFGIGVCQIQLCKYANQVGQDYGKKWGILSSTPYPAKQVVHYSG